MLPGDDQKYTIQIPNEYLMLFEKIQFQAKDIQRVFSSLSEQRSGNLSFGKFEKLNRKKVAWKLWKLAPGIFLCHLVLKGVLQRKQKIMVILWKFSMFKMFCYFFQALFSTDFSPLFITRFFLCLFLNNLKELKSFYCWWKNNGKITIVEIMKEGGKSPHKKFLKFPLYKNL